MSCKVSRGPFQPKLFHDCINKGQKNSLYLRSKAHILSWEREELRGVPIKKTLISEKLSIPIAWKKSSNSSTTWDLEGKQLLLQSPAQN